MSTEKVICNKSDLVNIADSIRTKLGVTDSYYLPQLSDAIDSIPTGIQLPTLINPGAASDLLVGKELIDQDGNVVTGTIPTKTSSDLTSSGAAVTVPSGYYASSVSKSVSTATQATPSISVNSSGLITASATQSAGYISSGTKSATKQLTTQAAKTITPGTSNQTAVVSGRYTTGAVTVKGDTNLKAENIAQGVSIFGVTGTHQGGSAPNLQSKSVTYTSNGTATVTPDSGYDGLSSVDVTVDVSGGGASVDTCTVTIDTTASLSLSGTAIAATCNNGIISYLYTDFGRDNTPVYPIYFNNIIKGTLFVIKNKFGFTNEIISENLRRISDSEYLVLGDGAIACNPCYVKNTNILLADKTSKLVQDITYQDELLVWDFDNGCYTSAKPLWIKKVQKSEQYYHCVFENGITLDLVGSNGNCHAIFNIEDSCFEYANKCVGKNIMTESGAIKLLSCEVKNETIDFYNIITNYHMNCFANNILTSTKMNNLYPISDMKFIKEYREIIPYEAFCDIPIEFYKGLRLDENKMEDIEKLREKVNKILLLMKAND